MWMQRKIVITGEGYYTGRQPFLWRNWGRHWTTTTTTSSCERAWQASKPFDLALANLMWQSVIWAISPWRVERFNVSRIKASRDVTGFQFQFYFHFRNEAFISELFVRCRHVKNSLTAAVLPAVVWICLCIVFIDMASMIRPISLSRQQARTAVGYLYRDKKQNVMFHYNSGRCKPIFKFFYVKYPEEMF